MFGAVLRVFRRPAARLHLGCAGLLLALVWLAYAPSLRHAPRSDQWCVLVDTLNDHTFLDTLNHTYSYNRTRRIAPGDTDLFRPILFALLAAEKASCEADLGAYQMIGIVLHIGVCALLIVLLRLIGSLNAAAASAESTGWITTCFPYAVAGFFALNPCIQELVIWTHLHGYLLFLVFLLGSCTLLIRHATQSQPENWRSPCLWGSWLLALLAAFTYELGQVYAILAGVLLAIVVAPQLGRGRAVKRFLTFATIAILYQGVNAVDLRSHPGEFVPDRNHIHIGDRLLRKWTIEHAGRFALYTTVQPFFPSVIENRFGGDRLEVLESLWTRHGRRNLGPAALVSAGVVVLALTLALAGLPHLRQSQIRLRLLVFLLFFSLFAVYSTMNVVGRMNLRPTPEILSSNSYYTYFALLFALVAAFTAWSALDHEARWVNNSKSVLVVGFFALTIVGAEHIRRTNQTVAVGMVDVSRPIRTVNAFVRHHRHEPDFSFRIDYSTSDRIMPVYGLPVTDVMFAKWTTPLEPKYWIAIRNGSVIVLSVREPRDTP